MAVDICRASGAQFRTADGVRGDEVFRRNALIPLLDRLAVPLVMLASAGLAFSLFAPVDDSQARTQAAPAATPRPQAAAAASGIAPNLASAAALGRDVNVGVFGDSFGDGIWWALDQELDGENGIEIHRLSRPATGFTSYQNVNLLDDIRVKLDRQPLDIAIVSFGANDTQGIMNEGRAAEYMGETWRRVIGARVDAIVTLLRSRGVQVYWVGLPRMRSEGYDEKAQRMNAFFASRMRALNVAFIDTVTTTQDAHGRFVASLPNPETGRLTPTRTNDGIHMTMSGYTMLTRGLAQRIRTTIAAARRQAGRPELRQAASPRGGGSRG
ncbi:MAG: uncharacterized protein QOD42_2106 [Sphingomonadales bacterium]|jgi:hypothetical protein|nr:uncharacterized protein [Sphingomonadales bacterium]